MRRLFPAFLLVLAACDNPVSYSGYLMAPYFPFDGERTWEFASTDTSLEYRLIATLDSEFEQGMGGSVSVYTVSYERKCANDAGSCTDGWVRDIRWSSNGGEGILIWGYEDGSGSVAFDPPVMLADAEMLADQTVTTTTGGATWTSTFHGLDTCPVTWTSEWGARCTHFDLDDGGANHAIAGEYWAITQYNVVAFQLAGDSGVWQLDYATYNP